MTDEMKAKVQEVIEAQVDEAVLQGWVEDRIYLSQFIGWMGEAMNLWPEEGVYDAWKEYDSETALEFYCWLLEMRNAIAGWEWDYAHQYIIIKKTE